ncbi:uracil-DNA glycosylase family protein [Acidisphaera sp. S103]|uniref:uracil-DNA glycosylase n=1 Tax=Acidisphaera sp. S103 TaxID=1747223 RepID=UPI00131E4363|nr:uracil-DNA glycosylase [Acidisphaera sp. S103]
MDDDFTLLRLQVEWGADEAIDLDPIDRLRPVESKPVPLLRPAPVTKDTPLAAPPKGTPGERAVGLAGQAASLDDLRAALADFDGCALRDTASNLVFAEGDPASTTLIVGEPPGREEDRSGHPFAGPEGQLLDQMLASIGLTRAELMLTPLLPWRPPGGRPASVAEIAICLPFLHRLIVLLKPHRIVVFGGTTARVLLPQTPNRRRNPRGWVEVSIPGLHQTLPILALPGLTEMLKTPLLRRDAWAGLRMLRRTLDGHQT